MQLLISHPDPPEPDRWLIDTIFLIGIFKSIHYTFYTNQMFQDHFHRFFERISFNNSVKNGISKGGTLKILQKEIDYGIFSSSNLLNMADIIKTL